MQLGEGAGWRLTGQELEGSRPPWPREKQRPRVRQSWPQQAAGNKERLNIETLALPLLSCTIWTVSFLNPSFPISNAGMVVVLSMPPSPPPPQPSNSNSNGTV